MSGLGWESTDFGKDCELSWMDNLFDIATSVTWEVPPICPPSTQGRQYPGYAINLMSEYDEVHDLRPPIINGTFA